MNSTEDESYDRKKKNKNKRKNKNKYKNAPEQRYTPHPPAPAPAPVPAPAPPKPVQQAPPSVHSALQSGIMNSSMCGVSSSAIMVGTPMGQQVYFVLNE